MPSPKSEQLMAVELQGKLGYFNHFAVKKMALHKIFTVTFAILTRNGINKHKKGHFNNSKWILSIYVKVQDLMRKSQIITWKKRPNNVFMLLQ